MDIDNDDALQRMWRESAQIQYDFTSTDASSFDFRAWPWPGPEAGYDDDYPSALDHPLTPAPNDVVQAFEARVEDLWASIGYPPANSRPPVSISPLSQPVVLREQQATSEVRDDFPSLSMLNGPFLKIR
ncbi:hypothetical protein FRB93_002537 [Tulasnella sp. JGI-2019a]|nr:hypothetical protein FRB93_002537 [Tulasnella sp. JGI-2019a]